MIIRASCGHYIDDNCKCQTQDQRLAEKIGATYEFCGVCGGVWDSHVAGGEDHEFIPESALEENTDRRGIDGNLK